MARKKKEVNNTNLHRATNLRVETNIQGQIIEDQLEVSKIFYKMNNQSDYSPQEDMIGLGLAGNAASRERLVKEKKQSSEPKPAPKAGKKPVDEKLDQAIKKDFKQRGIN